MPFKNLWTEADIMNVLMPQLGETVAEGTIAAWHKKVGDTVEKDEIILDVETDKAATEVPAPEAGVITAINVEEGQTVDVGVILAVINGPDAAEEGDSHDDVQPTNATAEREESSAQGQSSVTTAGAVSEASEPTLRQAAMETSQVAGSGERLRLSPVVRRLIAEHQLDPHQITGTGRDGRITRNDVLAFAATQKSAAAVAPAVSSAASPPPAVASRPAATQYSDGERVPFDRIRRLTAEHMVRSKATSPHVLQSMEVDFSGVDRVRRPARESWRAANGFSLTYLPFIARATCLAIREFPRINASVDGESLVIHRSINLSFAVALGLEGLVAPVIRDAGDLTVSGLAKRIADVSGRARDNALTADDLAGGTYTLTNNGSFGTLMTAPIINQPQVAILSVDAIKKRPVVIESSLGDTIGIRPIGILSQSFDHRAIDGGYSGAFLDKIRTLLEQHDWSTEI
jgi:pyruvate dehydrogenase E2 component (dihydrolipoamide acetyltransferase)